MTVTSRVIVVGAGVTGLTTALLLAEAGADVHVIAEQIPGGASLAAGAMWGPYLVEPRDKVEQWSRHSLDVFRVIADDPNTGVRITSGVEASRHAVPPPPWGPQLPDFRTCHADEIPVGFASGYRFAVPLIDMPAYLDYLQRRLLAWQVAVQHRTLAALDDAGPADVIVNCTGLGAGTLVPDAALRPIRGQHVVVTNPGLIEFFSEDTGDSEDLLCIYPHGDTVVLGGTAIDGRADLDPDPDAAQAILHRCAAVDPRLAHARIIEHRIAARPTRPEVRVEAERRDDGTLVIHNYGHGGAGVTLSWGCASEVLRLWEGNGRQR